MNVNRDAVFDALWEALAPFGLDAYTDGVMDSLDTVIEWPDEDDEEDDPEPPRSIEEYHEACESGTGCPETSGGPHYFAHIEPNFTRRTCIDCGEPEDKEDA